MKIARLFIATVLIFALSACQTAPTQTQSIIEQSAAGLLLALAGQATGIAVGQGCSQVAPPADLLVGCPQPPIDALPIVVQTALQQCIANSIALITWARATQAMCPAPGSAAASKAMR